LDLCKLKLDNHQQPWWSDGCHHSDYLCIHSKYELGYGGMKFQKIRVRRSANKTSRLVRTSSEQFEPSPFAHNSRHFRHLLVNTRPNVLHYSLCDFWRYVDYPEGAPNRDVRWISVQKTLLTHRILMSNQNLGMNDRNQPLSGVPSWWPEPLWPEILSDVRKESKREEICYIGKYSFYSCIHEYSWFITRYRKCHTNSILHKCEKLYFALS
jgi:hypothetical protein